jgi:hypothetical protein
MVAVCAFRVFVENAKTTRKNGLKSFNASFSVKSTGESTTVTNIIGNYYFQITLFFIQYKIIKVIGYGIGLGFIFQKYPLTIKGGAIGVNSTKVIRNFQA